MSITYCSFVSTECFFVVVIVVAPASCYTVCLHWAMLFCSQLPPPFRCSLHWTCVFFIFLLFSLFQCNGINSLGCLFEISVYQRNDIRLKSLFPFHMYALCSSAAAATHSISMENEWNENCFLYTPDLFLLMSHETNGSITWNIMRINLTLLCCGICLGEKKNVLKIYPLLVDCLDHQNDKIFFSQRMRFVVAVQQKRRHRTPTQKNTTQTTKPVQSLGLTLNCSRSKNFCFFSIVQQTQIGSLSVRTH